MKANSACKFNTCGDKINSHQNPYKQHPSLNLQSWNKKISPVLQLFFIFGQQVKNTRCSWSCCKHTSNVETGQGKKFKLSDSRTCSNILVPQLLEHIPLVLIIFSIYIELSDSLSRCLKQSVNANKAMAFYLIQ